MGPRIADRKQGDKSMPAIEKTKHKEGDFLVDYEEKVFEDVKQPRERRRSLHSTRSPSKARSAS